MKLPLEVSIKELAENGVLPVFDAGLNIATGKHPGYSIVNKFGKNPAVDVSKLPADIWDGGGIYNGFHMGEPLQFEMFSSNNNDRGEVILQYLPDWDSEEYITAPVRLNGTVPVLSGFTGIHAHTARYRNETPTGFNAGTITIRHAGSKGHVFCKMPIGRSQTACAAIRVPANHTGYVVRIFASVFFSREITIDGGLWIRDRAEGESPRIRRPFSCNEKRNFEENPTGGIPILSGGDVMMRIEESTDTPSGTPKVTGGFDIVFVKNANS